MKFLVVDDEELASKSLARTLQKVCPGASVLCANDYKTALEYAKQKPEVIFLDIEMPGMTGIELAERLLKMNEKQNIIFVTAYDDFALTAYKMHASGYLTKPYLAEDVAKELKNLRYAISDKNVRVKCFGNFEVFCDNLPIHFKRRSSKEIFAYLVNLNGSSASRAEISAVMWEDSEEIERKKDYFRALITSLRATLKEYGIEDIFISRRDSFAVNTQKFDCDYYRFLAGDTDPTVQFHGEYMTQYTWAETTLAQLIQEYGDWE